MNEACTLPGPSSLGSLIRGMLEPSSTPAGELALGLSDARGPAGLPGMAIDASWDPRMPMQSGLGPVVVWSEGRRPGGRMPLRAALGQIHRGVPGDGLGRAIERAAEVPEELAAVDREALAEAVTRQISHLQAVQLETAAGMLADAELRHPGVLGDGPRMLVDAFGSAQVSLSAAMTVTSRTAGDLLGLAFGLSTTLRVTLAALKAGQIDLARARVISDELSWGDFSDEQLRALEARALAGAEDLTASRLRPRVRRMVEQADPGAVQRRHDAAHKDRGTRTRDEGDGIASLTWTDDAAVIQAAQTRLDDLASAQVPGDGRSRPARRADALADLVLGPGLLTDPTEDLDDLADLTDPADGFARPAGTATDEAATDQAATDLALADEAAADEAAADEAAAGPATTTTTGAAAAAGAAGGVSTVVKLVVHVHQDVLRRMADGELQVRGGMAYLEGFGGIAPEQAKVLMAAASQMSITATDDDGLCLHESATHRYSPRAQMARDVRVQHQRCRFPGCRRPADEADLDHRCEHPEGLTCVCNLQPLCRGHHNHKTHGGWRVRLVDPARPAGALVWTSPVGRDYLDLPEDPLFGPPPPGPPPPRRGFGGDRDDPPF